MPIQIEELNIGNGLLGREIEPGQDTEELGRLVAELEERILALESAIQISDTEVTISGKKITIEAEEELVLDGGTGTMKLSPGGITVNASGFLRMLSGQFTVEAGSANFNSGICTFSGVVKSDTLITNTVIATTYTPGAGNVF